ncbi:hypothetical protein EV421DRAFT_1905969 [Armillaria borealis]|uniref:Uncharacterized protein n=1 Tax=Armillaria borealis TaxID=47425 RepID=A0AA39MM21_9AGAR|nr:hypothetical protein EV421DRAFT_1905969 [Armillaria borealis]
MSSSIKYHCSITPEPYEPALTPPELTFEEYKVLVNERASAEEKYSAAMGVHEEWKVEKAKEAREEKLRMGWEAQKAKVDALREAAEKKKELEQLAEEKQLADERELQRLAMLKQEKEAADKKKQDNLKKKKEEKKLRKEQKKAEKAVKAVESGKGAVEAMEATLVHEERGTDADTEGEMSEGAKKKALKKLKEIRDGKQRATAPVGPKRKWAPKSASVVEESDGESRPGPSKRVKTEVSGPMEGEEELIGNKRSSEKSICGHTCSRCKTKKAACSFNKGTSSALTVSSEEISELLEKLVHMVETLSNKVDILMGQVVSLGGHVDNLVDNFQSKEINSPEELISDMEE